MGGSYLRKFGARHRRKMYCVLGSTMVALGFAAVLFCNPESGVASGSCCSCHEEVCASVNEKAYVHAPVLEQKCASCHIAQEKLRPSGEEVLLPPQVKGKVSWLALDYMTKENHWLRLSAGHEGKNIVVRTEDESGHVIEQQLRVPAKTSVHQFTDNGKPPSVQDLRIREIHQGVVLSAVITWKTDKIADSAGQFGEKGLYNTVRNEQSLGTEHEVVLSGLAPKKTYKFAAVSQDLFGNVVTSEEIRFSTNQPAAKARSSRIKNRGALENTSLFTDFYYAQGEYLLQVRAQKPVNVKLGLVEGTGGQKKSALVKMVLEDGGSHLPLRDPSELTIKVCYSCHPGTEGVLTHPVEVFPKNGMVVPHDYSTLPNGKISCMSCHMPHASNNEYRLSRSSKKALCLGCHKNFV